MARNVAELGGQINSSYPAAKNGSGSTAPNLEERVKFERGDALVMPFADASLDGHAH
jgi:hypothetical protein